MQTFTFLLQTYLNRASVCSTTSCRECRLSFPKTVKITTFKMTTVATLESSRHTFVYIKIDNWFPINRQSMDEERFIMQRANLLVTLWFQGKRLEPRENARLCRTFPSVCANLIYQSFCLYFVCMSNDFFLHCYILLLNRKYEKYFTGPPSQCSVCYKPNLSTTLLTSNAIDI